MASNIIECDICYDAFSDEHCPRLLPCSHSLCTPCINEMISRHDKLVCPLCRKDFTASSAEDFTINRALLDVAKELSSIKVRSLMSPCGIERSLQDVINDFRTKVTKKGIEECQEIISQTLNEIETQNGMKENLLEKNKEIDRFIEVLTNLKLSNERILTTLDQNTRLLADSVDIMQQDEHKFKEYDAKVEATMDKASAAPIMDEAVMGFDDLKVKVKEVEDLLKKNEREREVIEKEILDSKKILEGVTNTMNTGTEDSLPVECQEEIHFATNKITIDGLRSLCGASLKNLRREIVAVKDFNGIQRVAQVKIGPNNQVFLSHLNETDIPNNSLIIKHDSLMHHESSRRAFIDLVLEETPIARLIVKVMEGGYKALNFLKMCAGDLGPSYANSRIMSVSSRGFKGERIFLGEYLTNDGLSRKAVLTGVDWERDEKKEIYKESSLTAGDVRGQVSHDQASWFYIVTRDYPNCTYDKCFGTVEEGLGVLRDVLSRYPEELLTKIKVADCGLVYSL